MNDLRKEKKYKKQWTRSRYSSLLMRRLQSQSSLDFVYKYKI